MENYSRTDLIKMIENLTDHLNTNFDRLHEIEDILQDTSKLSEDEARELNSEKDLINEDIGDIERDIGVYQEILHVLDMREIVDERSCSPYEERYDSWDEVFTGGDY